MLPCALIVDDEPDLLGLLALTLKRMNIDSDPAQTLRNAREKLHHRAYDLCLTDLKLPDGDGLALVEEVQARYPHTPIAVITAHGNMESAISALKMGAFDFIKKPVDLDVLRSQIRHALNLKGGGHRADPAATQAERLIGVSPLMQALQLEISKVARSDAPVHIHGESGTGKELIARLIHERSSRANGPFVPVNCGAIPADLVESEFFGHKKGSFTSAHMEKIGLFQAANQGTLFLDEIAELPLTMQVKLLRVLQERMCRPVGAQQEYPVDVRIITATHQDLKAQVGLGLFRHDLFYRIHVIVLEVPPLRARSTDIPLIADFLLGRIGTRDQRVLTLSAEAQQALVGYPYPGNVRELDNILERASVLSVGGKIGLEDLRFDQPFEMGKSLEQADSLNANLEETQKQAILMALDAHHWDREKVSKVLGITPRALRYRMKKLNICKLKKA